MRAIGAPGILDLPHEVLVHILSFLPENDMKTYEYVSKAFMRSVRFLLRRHEIALYIYSGCDDISKPWKEVEAVSQTLKRLSLVVHTENGFTNVPPLQFPCLEYFQYLSVSSDVDAVDILHYIICPNLQVLDIEAPRILSAGAIQWSTYPILKELRFSAKTPVHFENTIFPPGLVCVNLVCTVESLSALRDLKQLMILVLDIGNDEFVIDPGQTFPALTDFTLSAGLFSSTSNFNSSMPKVEEFFWNVTVEGEDTIVEFPDSFPECLASVYVKTHSWPMGLENYYLEVLALNYTSSIPLSLPQHGMYLATIVCVSIHVCDPSCVGDYAAVSLADRLSVFELSSHQMGDFARSVDGNYPASLQKITIVADYGNVDSDEDYDIQFYDNDRANIFISAMRQLMSLPLPPHIHVNAGGRYTRGLQLYERWEQLTDTDTDTD